MGNLKIDDIQSDLHNHSEDVVLETLEKLLESKQFENLCTCPQCLLDMATYSLNRIPAKYIASHSGSIHTKLEESYQQSQVDIVKVVTKAINVISNNPSDSCVNKNN